MALRVMVVLPTHTYRAAPFLDAAHRNGLDVVIASNEPSSLIAFMAGRYLTLDLGRPEEGADRAAEFVEDRRIDGVLGVDEASVVTAAHIAARLGVPHNPAAAVEATRDKRRLRARLAAAGISQPDFVELAGDDMAGAVRLVDVSIGYPCVIKPVDRAGSQGVIRADDPAALELAIARVVRMLRSGEGNGRVPVPLLAERFVPGAEVAVEGLITGGDLTVITIFDKPDPLNGPFFEETIYVSPSRLPARVAAEITAVIRRAVAAVGLTDGPIHAEVRLPKQGPVIIEVAARSIGGLCSRSLRFSSGATIEDVIVRQCAGLGAGDLSLAGGATGVLMLPIPSAGVLVAVGGLDEARAVSGIRDVAITIPPGTAVVPLPEGDRYLGFVFAEGETASDVERALRRAHDCLHIDILTTPSPPPSPAPRPWRS